MATGGIHLAGKDLANVTMKRVVNGDIQYIIVNRAYESIVVFEHSGESAWPVGDDCMCLANVLNVAFFALAYILLDTTSQQRITHFIRKYVTDLA